MALRAPTRAIKTNILLLAGCYDYQTHLILVYSVQMGMRLIIRSVIKGVTEWNRKENLFLHGSTHHPQLQRSQTACPIRFSF